MLLTFFGGKAPTPRYLVPCFQVRGQEHRLEFLACKGKKVKNLIKLFRINILNDLLLLKLGMRNGEIEPEHLRE